MEIKNTLSDAVKQLSAIAHEGRLTLLRLLIRAGPDGLPATTLARSAGTKLPTASAQLLVLGNAGLVTSSRSGRQIIYTANFRTMTDLLSYLTLDCCGGSATICEPLLPQIHNALNCCHSPDHPPR